MRSARATLATGAILCLAVFLFGISRVSLAWPFACYPTFAPVPNPVTRTISVGVRAPGAAMRFMPVLNTDAIGSDQARGLIDTALYTDPGKRRGRLVALLAIWKQQNPALSLNSQANLYLDTFSVMPTEHRQIQRELLPKGSRRE